MSQPSNYTKPFTNRIGGKFYISKQLIKYIPKHKIYIEPFIGAGAVLFRKPYISEIEIINDIDKDMIDFYNSIKETDNDKVQQFNLDNITREQYYEIKKTEYTEPEDILFKQIVLWKWSYAGSRASYCRSIRKGISPKNIAITFKKDFLKIQERIKDIIIYNKDFKEIILNNDNEDVFMYIDPPYSKMMKWWHYKNLVSREDLYNTISQINKAKFILSYDDTPENRELFKDYYINEIKTRYCCNHKLWYNQIELLISNFKI